MRPLRRRQLETAPAKDVVGPHGPPQAPGVDRLGPVEAGLPVGFDQFLGGHVGGGVRDQEGEAGGVELQECRITQAEEPELIFVGADEEVDARGRALLNRGERMLREE